MPPPLFQVIAQITTDDFDLLERVQKGLSRTFNLDLNPYRAELRAAGVCVARAASLPEAEEKAQLARGIGADYRIVDPQNRTVRQGFGRRGEASSRAVVGPERTEQQTTSGARRDDPPTLLGGFNAPAPVGRTPSGLQARIRPPSREDPALALTLQGAPGSGAAGPTAGLMRPDPSGELDLLSSEAIAGSPVSPVPASSKSAFNLDALDADDLVLLDGSREEQPKPSKSGLLKQASAAEMAFAPPTADEDLELEESARPAPPPPSPRAPSQPMDLLPEPEPADNLPEVSALAEEALILDRPAAPVAPAASAPLRPARPSEAQRSARHTASASPAVKVFGPGRLLFGGWFRERPRLRILVGFVLALGLASIVPACHARSVLSSRVTPQLEDLSTAKAHGQILSRLPNYRSPEAIEEEISSIKTRGKVISFVLWLLIGGGLGFAWFRFT